MIRSLRLQRLSVHNFRNLANETIEFSPHVNLLIGENGQGKTNVLEAVHFFKFGRTYRAQKDTEVIRFGEEYARIEVLSRYAGGHELRLSMSIEAGGGKKLKIDHRDIS